MAYPAEGSALKGDFVIRPRRFAIDASLQFTKRELQSVMSSPVLWAGMAGASILLGLVGPFGTYDQLPLAARLAYWTAVVVSTYLTGFVIVHFAVHMLFGEDRGGVMGYGVAGALAGIPVAGLVALFNRFVFGASSSFGFVTALPYVVATAALVSALVAFIMHKATAGPTAAAEALRPPPRPRILDRLPAEKRGRLAYLSMQDHYVEVHTSRGSGLVLMRMADAIAETEGEAGLRIHRSHWVALNAVDRLERRGGKLLLRMRDGVELPVSRSYAEAVRAAGFK